jgi:hypothetical protein
LPVIVLSNNGCRFWSNIVKPLLNIRYNGRFRARISDGPELPLGAKHQALLALLCTAEDGIRTRTHLETTLWSLAQPRQAKASLRTALSTLRRYFGPAADVLLSADRRQITLNMDRVQIETGGADDVFMEGFVLPHEEAFEMWLLQMRNSPALAGAQTSHERQSNAA